MLLEKGDSQTEPLIVAHDAPHHLEFRPSEEPAATVQFAEQTGKYLYQPSKAVLKAGAFRLLSERYNLKKLAPSTHLYTSDTVTKDFPGKCFEVESVLEWNKASLRQLKQSYDRLEMTAMNFPLTTDALREKIGIPGGGTRHLFATTMKGRKILLVTLI